jgi:hypothetical protein
MLKASSTGGPERLDMGSMNDLERLAESRTNGAARTSLQDRIRHARVAIARDEAAIVHARKAGDLLEVRMLTYDLANRRIHLAELLGEHVPAINWHAT